MNSLFLQRGDSSKPPPLTWVTLLEELLVVEQVLPTALPAAARPPPPPPPTSALPGPTQPDLVLLSMAQPRLAQRDAPVHDPRC